MQWCNLSALTARRCVPSVRSVIIDGALLGSEIGVDKLWDSYWEICMWYILWWEVVRLSICGSNRGH